MQEKKSRFLKDGEEAIYDSVSSLTWLARDSWLILEKEVTWEEAGKWAASLNEQSFAGHNDWRVPTVQEALSLYDAEKLNKDFKGGDIHMDAMFPPGCNNCTWTSDERGREAQIVFFANGCPYWYSKDDQTLSHSVRLVRRG
ncbi:MAG: DUF1566 domain-containing protein [Nitrospinaceae bacterium]